MNRIFGYYLDKAASDGDIKKSISFNFDEVDPETKTVQTRCQVLLTAQNMSLCHIGIVPYYILQLLWNWMGVFQEETTQSLILTRMWR